jgi:hypothetical protein
MKRYVKKANLYVDKKDYLPEEELFKHISTKKVFICDDILSDIFHAKTDKEKRMNFSELHKKVTELFPKKPKPENSEATTSNATTSNATTTINATPSTTAPSKQKKSKANH